MECSSPASGHRASRNSRNREASPVSSFDSALAAHLCHPPPRRRASAASVASVASAASSRAPAVAPAPLAFSSSARLRNCLAHALHRNTSNAPRLTACPVHVPHPKHLCIHPAEGMFVPGTYACAFGSSFETPAFVPDARASVFVDCSVFVECFSKAFRRSSSAFRRVESVERPEASVDRPQASVSCCSTRHTLSDATDAHARLASRDALGVRRPALVGELGPASSLSRVRSLSSDEGASEGSARARDRANDRSLSTPCDCRTRKILARCCEGGVATKGDTGAARPSVPSIRARFFPASPPAIETSTSRANISARLRVTRRLFEYSDRLRFCSERESESAHVMRPIGALQLWYRRTSPAFSPSIRKPARVAANAFFWTRKKRREAALAFFSLRQSAHRVSA